MITLLTGLGDRLIQATAIALLILLWALATANNWVSPVILPDPLDVWHDLIILVQSEALYQHMSVTLLEIAGALSIATVTGLSIGLWIGMSRYHTQVFEPMISGAYAVPLIIFVPLFILAFGLGMQSKIAFGATYAFFPIVLNTIGGIGQIDQRHLLLARSMRAPRRLVFWRIILPGALPVIVTGIRVACITGFLSIIAVEMLAGLGGLGSQIARLSEAMNTSQMFAYIVVVIVLSAFLNLALALMESRFGPKVELL